MADKDSPDNRFMGDDEESQALTVIRAGEKSGDEPDDEEADDDGDDEGAAEDDFLKWADDMDQEDEKSKRADALGAIAMRGRDLTSSPDDGPPLKDRSTAYLAAYAASLRADEIKEEAGKFCVYSSDGSKKLGEYDTRDEAEQRLAEIERFKADDGEGGVTRHVNPKAESLDLVHNSKK